MNHYIIVTGTVIDGLRFHGPFSTPGAAQAYAEAIGPIRHGHQIVKLELDAQRDECSPRGIVRPILDLSGPQRNADAAETATEVECPFCKQGIGQACVTSSLNEATFTHMDRIHARLDQMTRQVILFNKPTEQQPDACPCCGSTRKHIANPPCNTVKVGLHPWHDAPSRAVKPEWMDDKDFVG